MEGLEQRLRDSGQQQQQHHHATHDPSELSFPQVPRHELGSHKPGNDITLPDLRTVLSPQFEAHANASAEAFAARGSPVSARSLPPIDIGNNAGFANGTRRSIDAAMASPSEAGSMRGDEERGRRAKSVISMEDPDVRLAAEALSGLGNPDFVRSPTNMPRQTMSPQSNTLISTSSRDAEMENEPLLQLFASKHPWVGGTMNASINSSMFVYNTTKHYSPRFVQYGANLVERNIATPMVNTVGSVGRYTGVESGLRRYLDERRPHDVEKGDEDRMDIDSPGGVRRDSVDNLPPYRASKPPSYREEYSPAAMDRSQERPPHNRSWSSQVAGQMFVMTSGLGVALSVTSRRSLQYCLQALGQATVHIATVSDALKMVLEQYDEARDSWHKQNEKSLEAGERPRTPDHDEAARRLADIIKKHSDDIWTTLKHVTNFVSSSAGGALPENARHFVTNQLMSLPQRWRLVSANQTGESETSRGAHRMIAFATEGLDMMSQVSHVVKATLESAERWLERVGRRGDMEYQNQHPQGHLDEKAQADRQGQYT